MNLFQASDRQSMINRLAANGVDKDTWRSDTPTAVLQPDTSESKAILTLKEELTEIKTTHVKVTTTEEHQLNNKHRHEGGPRTDPKGHWTSRYTSR